MNSLKKFLLFSFFIINSIHTKAQKELVKKDSASMIPFISKQFYSSDLDTILQISPKIDYNHKVSPIPKSFNENVLIGNMGSPLVPILFENKFYQKINLGRDITNNYFYSADNIPYFALNKPISELDFIFFGNGNEEFKGFLSQNLSKRVNLGIGIRRGSNKGYFSEQQNEHNNLYVYGVYQNKRWRTNLEFLFNELNLRESGGYTSDIYRENLSPSKWNSTGTILKDANNRFKNYQINWRNRWLITPLNNPSDSLLFIPIKSNVFIDHQLKYSSERLFYNDALDSISKVEYGVYGLSPINVLTSKYLSTSFSSHFSLNYTDKNLSLKAYNITELNQIFQSRVFDESFLWSKYLNMAIGGELRLNLPEKLRLEGKLYKPFSGYTQEDFLISGGIHKQQKDWNFSLQSQYSRQLPAYLYNYALNTSKDTFYDLKTQNVFENGITIVNPKLKLVMKAQYFLIENFLSFDSLNAPLQIQNNFYQFYFHKELKYKSLYFPTTILYQNSVFHRGMIKQMVAFKNKLFSDKNNVLVGADISLNFNFVEPKYSSYLMQPIYSSTMNNALIYPKVDLFATFKISKVHVSLIFDNFMSTYLSSGTNYMKNYPITPSVFYFRTNWVFLE